MDQKALEAAFREAGRDALADLAGLGAQSRDSILDTYAPMFAELATLSGDDAREIYADILLNMENDADIKLIDAQTAGTRAVFRILKALAAYARAFVIPGLPPV